MSQVFNGLNFPFIEGALTNIPYQSMLIILTSLEPNKEYEVRTSGSPGHCVDVGNYLTGDFVQYKKVTSNDEGILLLRAKVNSSNNPLTETVCFVEIGDDKAAFRVTTASILPLDNNKRYINIETKELFSQTEIRLKLSDVSLPTIEWTDEVLNPIGYACIDRIGIRPEPEFNQKVIDGEPYEEEGKWFLPWNLCGLVESEIINKKMEQRASMIVSPFQAKAALHRAGLLDNVKQLISNEDTDILIRLAWEEAIEFRRLSPIIQTLGSILELTEEQIDDLFTDAQSIQI